MSTAIWQKAASSTCHPLRPQMDSSNIDPHYNIWFLGRIWVSS